jgi:hypothetical protein
MQNNNNKINQSNWYISSHHKKDKTYQHHQHQQSHFNPSHSLRFSSAFRVLLHRFNKLYSTSFNISFTAIQGKSIRNSNTMQVATANLVLRPGATIVPFLPFLGFQLFFLVAAQDTRWDNKKARIVWPSYFYSRRATTTTATTASAWKVHLLHDDRHRHYYHHDHSSRRH